MNARASPRGLAPALSTFAKASADRLVLNGQNGAQPPSPGYGATGGVTRPTADAGRPAVTDSLTARKPRKTMVPLAVGLGWRPNDALYLRKYDGVFATLANIPTSLGRVTLLGEEMTGKSGALLTASDRALLSEHGQFFAAFTVAEIDGQSMLKENTSRRWDLLQKIMAAVADRRYIIAEEVADGEGVEAVLSAGGEGVCAFDWGSPWGAMRACKRLQTWYCVVTGFVAHKQSVQIQRIADGGWKMESVPDGRSSILYSPSSLVPAGAVALRGGKCDRIRIGSIIKVEGMGLTDAGLIREPRVCQDTPMSWLVRF